MGNMKALLMLLFVPFLAWSQPAVEGRPTRFSAELGGFYSPTGRAPFWLQANQYGIVPNPLPYATLRIGVWQNYSYEPISETLLKKKKSFFNFGYGAEVVGNVGKTSRTPLLLSEAYAKLRAGAFEVVAGRRREVVGLVDSTLGTGAYSWSGNALPLPKIQIGLPDYTPIGFTKGIVSFRGLIAHGWFGNGLIVQHYYLHQKALYGRLGKASWPVKLYGGFNHQVQWGGRTSHLSESLVKGGRFPARMQDYYYVVAGNSLGRLVNVDTTRYSVFDRENRVGNHLGSVDVGFELTLRNVSLLLYRQSVYEDGSLFYLSNIVDGLNGIRFRNLTPAQKGFRITGAVVEFLYTKSQGGSSFSAGDHFRGRDNYFNHAQYRDGWSYRGRTIGPPFITPFETTRANLPRYGFANNNRVRVLHAGIQGSFAKQATFSIKASYSQNYGTYEIPFPQPVDQFSCLSTVQFPLNQCDWLVNIAVAADQGLLYDNSQGIYVGLRKTWAHYKYRVVK